MPDDRFRPPPQEEVFLELDRPAGDPANEQVVDRIRIGGPAVVARTLILSAAVAFGLYQALRFVYRW